MGEALKEIWKTKFKKAIESEHNVIAPANKREVELLKLKIDLCIDIGDIKGFKKFSEQLRKTESFLNLKVG